MANFVQRLLSARAEKRSIPDVSVDWGFWGRTAAGANIGHGNAMQIDAVYACVSKIATTIATLGVDILRRDGNDLLRDPLHPVYALVTRNPNPHQTAFEFWETLIAAAVLRGAGYAVINRDASGLPIELIPIDSDSVTRHNDGGEIYYILSGDGEVIPEFNMLEICNLNRQSPVALHRDNLGLAREAQDFGSKYFANGGQMTGILTAVNPIKPEQIAALVKSWKSAARQGGTQLVPFDMDYKKIGISPDEAQFLQTRKYQAISICRIFSVPPAIIQIESQTTYNNVEQQNLQFARHTITPWTRRIEQELERKLLFENEQTSVSISFNLNDLHRGDMAARSAFYTTALQNGWLSINEVRDREKLNPVEGGDTHTIGSNQLSLNYLEAFSKKVAAENSLISQNGKSK